MKTAASIASLAAAIAPASATPGFMVAPTGQVTGSTCQSYSLAVALAFKRDPGFSIDTAAQLRSAEQAIRAAIVKEAAGAPVTHDHIRAGFRVYTGGRYLLKMHDVDIAQLGAFAAQRSGVGSEAATPPTFLMGSVVKDVVLSSATRIGSDRYASGHIFTVLGSDGGPNSSQKLLVLNSAMKVRDTTKNSCSDGVPDDPGPYTASISWRPIATLELKQFSTGKARVWLVDKP